MFNQTDTPLLIAESIIQQVKSQVPNCSVGIVREQDEIFVYFFPTYHTPIAKYSLKISLRTHRSTLGLRQGSIAPSDWTVVSINLLPQLIQILQKLMYC